MAGRKKGIRLFGLTMIIIAIAIYGSRIYSANYKSYGIFHFVNETPHTIEFLDRDTSLQILPKAKAVIRSENSNGANAGDYASLFANGNLTIKFDQNKCLIHIKKDDVHSIREIKNFVTQEINDDTYRFTYIFTEEDYNRATPCP